MITASADRWGNSVVTLEAGDVLASCRGPTTVFVPLRPGNADYDALVARGIAIAPYVQPLDELKAEFAAEIDTRAEAERLVHMTAGAGQALVYREKADEADRYLADPSPTAERYPILMASVGIEAETLPLVAALVSARRVAWARLAAAIEQARLGAKKAIMAAPTADAARTARMAVAWPTSGTPAPPAAPEK